MAENNNDSNELAKQNKRQSYEQELAKRRLFERIGYGALTLVAVFLIMLFSGDRFARVLRFFGLQPIVTFGTGLYADCSRPENKDSPYCNKKSSPVDREWSEMQHRGAGGKAAPFSLNDQ